MQTLYTIEDQESGGVKTLLHVSSYYQYGTSVSIYLSDEFGTHKKRLYQHFLHIPEILYHRNLRTRLKKKGAIIHKRVSETPLKKTTKSKSEYSNRDTRGRFVKLKNIKNGFSSN